MPTRETVEVSIAVLSDIHGNRQAFEAVLEATREAGCQAVWCLGDLVGYGADPDACVDLAREHAAVCLAGNHDLGVTGAIPLEQFSRGAGLAAEWTRQTIRPDTLDFLAGLKPSDTSHDVALYHASPRDPVWEYVLSPRDGDPRAAWLELDLAREAVIHHRVDYDIAGAAAAIRSAHLPDSLAERLQYGQ